MANIERAASRPLARAVETVYAPIDLHQGRRSEYCASDMSIKPWHTPSAIRDSTLVVSGPRVSLSGQRSPRPTEEPGENGRCTGRSRIFSPPVSPTSQPLVDDSGHRDQIQNSPTRRPAAVIVKEESGPDHDSNMPYQLPAESYFQNYIPVSGVETLRQPAPSQVSLADAVSQAFNPTPASPTVSVPSIFSSPTSGGIADQQRDLFEALLRICTNAAGTYWRSQCRSHSAVVVYRPRAEHGRYHVVPYGCPFTRPNHVLLGAQRRRARAAEAPRGLMDFLVRIADGLWERAMASGSHAEELQAVHRMGNLYSWGERVLGAACGTEVSSDEAVYAVVMAARDLASWLLCEEGKRAIDGLWEGRWGVGGFVSGAAD